MTGPGRYVREVTGDQVRDTTFSIVGKGYDVTQVDDLLGRVADVLDAGRPAGELIRNAALRAGVRPGYDIDAVDWFLGQLLRFPLPGELAEMSSDPWRDLAVVAQFTKGGAGDLAGRSAGRRRRALGRHYPGQCETAWRDFDRQPGTCLRLEWAGVLGRELRTMENQAIASMTYQWSRVLSLVVDPRPHQVRGVPELWDHLSVRGKSFRLRRTDAAQSSDPSIAEIASRRSLDFDGHFTAAPKISQSRARFSKALRLRELVDETGMAILRISGMNFDQRALAVITFPDQRSMWFPVRGTGYRDAIMTAVDEAGRSVARYRIVRPDSVLGRNIAQMLDRHAIEVTIHPGRELTDELAIAIMIAAPWLPMYFSALGGG